jgi:elongation factor Ts
VTTQGAIGHYLHYQADRPVIGVVVELAAETDFVAKSPEFQQAARDIAMHVAASRPRWVRRDEIPEETLAHERELIDAQARNEGKPDKVIERIVEGRLRVFYEEHVLYDQPFVNPEKFQGTVGEMVDGLVASMGENILVRRFARIGVGEPIA